MGFINKVTNWFKKGGAAVGMISSLQSITDHPKINIDPSEYKRIQEAMKYYKGDLPKESYKDSVGKERTRTFYDLPIPSIVSDYLANLIVNESFDVQVKQDKSKVNEFVATALDDNDFKKKFGEYLSPMFAVGGLAVRPYVDGDKVKFNWALADAFFPLRNNTNNVSEGVFISTTSRYDSKKPKFYTLLEFHEWIDGVYTITNELYLSEERGTVGVQVNLNTIYDDVEPISAYPELERPLFVYLKPAGFNNINTHSPLGLGVVDNAKKILDQINETNNQMHYDMRKAKPRIIGTEHYFRMGLAENGIAGNVKFDTDSDEFMILPGDEAFLKDLTFGFDPKPYDDKINYHLRWLEQKVKLQQGTFSFNYQTGIKTATQVVSEDSDTFRTRNMEISQISSFVSELVVTICELGTKFDIYHDEIPVYEEISIDFDDGIFTNKQQESEFYSQGLVNETLPKVEFIQRVYKVNEQQAEEWLAKIAEEKRQFSPEYQQTMAEVGMLGKLES